MCPYAKVPKKQVYLILTKSISRFARNTLDFLKALRELQSLNIDIYFELENLWLHEQTIQLAISYMVQWRRLRVRI